MIAIVNLGKDLNNKGEQTYSLRINLTKICQFTHRRENGLAACLYAAAKKAEEHDNYSPWFSLYSKGTSSNSI